MFYLCLSAIVSGLACCIHSVIVFEYLTVFFWFITSFDSLNHHTVIKSQVSACYPVDVLSEPGYNLTVFCFSKVKLLFAVSSLTKVILIKVYRVLFLQPFLLSAHPLPKISSFGKALVLSNCWLILSMIYPIQNSLNLDLYDVTKFWPS